jgi:signal transduction histidine kinase
VAAFTVDTKLFQELGELLVAKEATALVELVKNAYDADATSVRVHGENLRDSATGSIVVTDNGFGMTDTEFENGFLRIAGRTKITADRRTPVFGRRFTGEKGVGRLAAHKLARIVAIASRKAGPTPKGSEELAPAVSSIVAKIDWDAVEALETLDQVAKSGAVTLRDKPLPDSRKLASGTRLTLTPLRRPWSDRMIAAFLNEAVTLAPTPVLFEKLPDKILAEPLLFERIRVRDQVSTDPGFLINFSGDLEVPDLVTPDVAASASWIAELDYDRATGWLRVAVSPTVGGLREAPGAEGFSFRRKLAKEAGPSFQARVLQRSGRTWEQAVQGVRIFMEGFRVAPYGDATDDWLGIDRSYRSRAHRQLSSLDRLKSDGVPEGLEIEELAMQGNAHYMGAVYLHRSSSPELEMLVNREGFLPGGGLDFIADWVRVATDLIVRLGYASRFEVKEVKREERVRQRQVARRADVGETPSALRVRESAKEAGRQLETVRNALRTGDYKKAAEAATAAQPHFEDVSALSEEFGSEAVLWRVLASLGTELAAFVHEVHALALDAAEIVGELDSVLPLVSARNVRSPIQRARKSAFALADRIRRNANYLVDATSFSGRRRRSRLPLRDRFEAVLPFFETRLRRRGITFSNDIPADLRTPPMFPSELAGIFTNLMSNAAKFAGEGGRIAVTAEVSGEGMRVTMQNTGAEVNLKTAAKLFEAFQSTTERPDAVLGQGMGMGLTITRAFIQEYGGFIEFVEPASGYATAIQFTVPAR